MKGGRLGCLGIISEGGGRVGRDVGKGKAGDARRDIWV